MEDQNDPLTGFAKVAEDLQAQIRETFEGRELEALRVTLQPFDVDRVDEHMAPFFESLKWDASRASPLFQAYQESIEGISAFVSRITEQLPSVSEYVDRIHAQYAVPAISQVAARIADDLSLHQTNVRQALMQASERMTASRTDLFPDETQLVEAIRATWSPLLPSQEQAVALANADIFKTTFVSGLLREERLLAERAALIHSDVTTALSQAVERFQPIATTLTQAFERIPTDHLVGLGRIGEELRPIALEYRQPDLSLSFTDLSEFGQPMLPYIEVEPRCLPLFEPQRRPPLDSYEWPAVPTDLQAKPASEIAQETEIYYRALLEKSELNAWEILDEHERRYTEEIEQAEWDLIEAEEAGDDETAKRMAHMKRIYIVKRRALRCSRRLYLSQVGLSSEQALEASHKVMKYNERTVMIGVALIGYLNMNRCLPDFQGQKEVFYKWCATVIGKGRTSVVNALTQSGCLVKGRRGSAGEGLEETIQHIIQYARRYQ